MSLKILIRTPNHLGDCVMALPMINEVREAYAGSTVTLLTPENLADLFQGNPGIDAIVKIPSTHIHGLLAVVKIRDIIASLGSDLGYIIPPSFGAAASFKLAGVKERIGYIADGRRLLLTRQFPLPAPLNSQHRSITYFDLLRRSVGRDLEYTRPKLFLTEEDHLHAETLLAGFGVPADERFVTIAFRSVAESRQWGAVHYTDLTRMLIAQYDIKVLLMGSSDDARIGDEIVASSESKNVINLAGKATLREAATIISRARIFVGDDSGPAHLAAAVGTPVLVLFGAGDPAETAPLPRFGRIVRCENLECLACVRNKCPLKGTPHMRCMRDLTPAVVMAEISALAKESGNPL